MTSMKIRNPFGAPVYYEETVSSTMDFSRQLAARGEPHGTVIFAGFQEAGRGRIRDRAWEMDRESNLPFTILLRYPGIENIPKALTLRTGLAVCLGIEDFSPTLQDMVKIKWPNDIMIGQGKTAGILCETDGGSVHIGIGVNAAQKEFPMHLKEKATSIALAAGRDYCCGDRFCLLEKILIRLYSELTHSESGETWKWRIEQRLYEKGKQVSFMNGAAGSGAVVTGCLSGISQEGELLIIPAGETQARAFITGELAFPFIDKKNKNRYIDY